MSRKSILMAVVMLMYLCGGGDLSAITMHNPDFTLTISSKADKVVAKKDLKLDLDVKETNISNHVVQTARRSDPITWYEMNVLFNGGPAIYTAKYQEFEHPQSIDPRALNKINVLLGTLEPHESETFSIPIGDYVDFSQAGRYQVTISRGTDGSADDSVTVKSNTIVVVVVAAE